MAGDRDRLVPAHVRDLQRPARHRVHAAPAALHLAVEDAEPGAAQRLLARAEEHLQPEADAEVRPLSPEVFPHRIAERAGEGARAVAETRPDRA